MKVRFLLITISYLSVSCNSNNKSQHSIESSEFLSVSVTVVNHVNSEWFKQERGFYRFDLAPDTGNLFPIEISMKNSSDSVLHFWEMTCLWQLNWISGDTIIGIFPPNCDGNFPARRMLEPGKEYSHKCFIWSQRPVDEITDHEMKIGFILIREQDYHVFPYMDYDSLVSQRRKSKENLVWSNSFKLK